MFGIYCRNLQPYSRLILSQSQSNDDLVDCVALVICVLSFLIFEQFTESSMTNNLVRPVVSLYVCACVSQVLCFIC